MDSGDTFLRALLDHSSDVITILNGGGTILFQSPSVRRILGYEQDELVGSDALARVHPDDRDTAAEVLRRPLEDGSTHGPTVYRYLHRDGSWRLMEATSRRRLGGVVVNARDVTAEREAEAALQRSERHYRSLFENAADVVTILEEDGTIRYESPSAERVMGWRPEELVGRGVFEFVHPEDAPAVACTFERVLRTPGEVHAFELRFLHLDGSWRVLDGLARNLLHDPAVRGIVVNSRDVTDRRLAEEALVRARDAAEAASRAKSDFLSSMSHELRTPLNSVIGFTNVLLRNRAGNQREADLNYLARILANGKHLLGLIDDILDLSKIEAGRMELELGEVAVDRLVLETLAELKGTVGGKPVELRVRSPDRVALLETDAGRLKQVLINLVGNAIKFTERGSVTVALEVDPESHRPLRLEVRDTGVGIPRERLADIFLAFEQGESGTARRFGGTGLGLAISSSFCELMGFRLEVESEVGAGSRFAIVLGEEGPAREGCGDGECGEAVPALGQGVG
jgi:PAS domain S-box-containing protein